VRGVSLARARRAPDGPSLAGVVGRRAGSAPGFNRYSEAITSSSVRWEPETLQRWLADPQAVIPGTSMRMRPVEDPAMREDIIALLESRRDARTGALRVRGGVPMANLVEVGGEHRVRAIKRCGDTYHVRLASGETRSYWEFNLRFKTDSTSKGPPPGAPAIVGTGMGGDRAQIVFAHFAEIGAFIEACPKAAGEHRG
jgi:cytochrome c